MVGIVTLSGVGGIGYLSRNQGADGRKRVSECNRLISSVENRFKTGSRSFSIMSDQAQTVPLGEGYPFRGASREAFF